MRFFEVLDGTKILETNIYCFDFCFGKICSKSNEVSPGDVFICRCGSKADGHNFIETAYKNGARTFVVEKTTSFLKNNPDIRYIRVDDTSKAEAKMLACLHGHPTKNMRLIGITGTNGKTSTAFMLKQIFDFAGYKTGIIGTVKATVGDRDITKKKNISNYSDMTTPAPDELYDYLSEMEKEGAQIVILEASSHALSQKRLDALDFDVGIFTNLSEDHLDYHKSLKEYRQAKMHLFDLCKQALINSDTDECRYFLDNITCKARTYGKSSSDFRLKNTYFDGEYNNLELESGEKSIKLISPILGSFTPYNIAASVACAKLFGIDDDIIKNAILKLKNIPGRLEKADSVSGARIYSDYAHSPDALEKTIITLREICNGRLFTLFGCGGDREREKRPIMGRIATSLSDYTIITSDNPRTEDPNKIIKDILMGVKPNSRYEIIENRKEAIKRALGLICENDVLLLAGKGHEDYEITLSGKHVFSEKKIINEYYQSQITKQ